QRVPGAAFHAGVVGANDDLAAADDADAGDLAGARNFAFVGHVRGERREFEKRRAGVEQERETITHEELLLPREALEIALRTLEARFILSPPELGDPREVLFAVLEEA